MSLCAARRLADRKSEIEAHTKLTTHALDRQSSLPQGLWDTLLANAEIFVPWHG
jgi:hypothetical protein